MIYLVVVLIALSVTTLTYGVANAVTGQGRVVRQRLADIRTGGVSREAASKRRRLHRREALQGMLEAFGDQLTGSEEKSSALHRRLLSAGYRHSKAPALFMAARVLGTAGLLLLTAFLVGIAGVDPTLRLLLLIVAGLLGWMIPFIVLKQKIKKRTRALQRGLADAIDILVVCVEAGLGLNQALMRVAEEMDRVSPEISDELTMVTLEMRAGTPRNDAMKNMATRTGLEDVRSWVNMMVQTERFGTSIADSLRVHSDTMRTKRKQRAEEAAAKLTVKMLIPLVLFVFPAMFVIILGPAVISFREFMGGM